MPARPWHRCLALAALAALLLRAWIPAGFMPASDGSFALILCPGTAPTISSLAQPDPLPAAHHHHHDGHSDKGSEAPCPFAVAALGAAPPLPPALAPPLPAPAAALDAPARVRLAAAWPSHVRPPPTGPPASL
jgi:hypothetical protein